MASRYNEGKAIEAVLRRIEARDQAVRLNDGRSPDDLNDPDPLRRVDYVCTVGKTLHAFEHTGIEPFADQIELEVHNRKLFAPIVTRFSNRPDRELWEFHVPVEAPALSDRRTGQGHSGRTDRMDRSECLALSGDLVVRQVRQSTSWGDGP